jgi:glycosyltransferase involved in cell wall biosynthesis
MEFQRSPLTRDNYSAYKKLKKLIIEKNYDVVHTHTPVASVCARLACRNLDNVKVIYTAHGFHFFNGAPLKNWLIYYPVERWLARYTDILITINKEDYSRAQTLKAKKVAYIPGVGLDTKKFGRVVVDKSAKRRELGVPDDAFVLLSVGELNKNKNHETIIKAVAKLNNPKVYYIICGSGSRKHYLNELAKNLGLEKQVKLLGFRNDIAEICKSADIFAFPSHREGLGIAALEAMAAGLPIVTAHIHGIIDYSVDGITGYTCNPADVDGFAKSIDKLLKCPEKRLAMAAHNIEAVKAFDISNVSKRMQEIYSGIWLDKSVNEISTKTIRHKRRI